MKLKTLSITLLFTMLLLLLTACGSVVQAEHPNREITLNEVAAKQPTKIGSIEVTITDAKGVTQKEGLSALSGRSYLVFSLTIKNLSTSEALLPMTNYALKDSRGQNTAQMPSDKWILQLAAGETKKGDAIFAITNDPEGHAIFSFQITHAIQTATWNLNVKTA